MVILAALCLANGLKMHDAGRLSWFAYCSPRLSRRFATSRRLNQKDRRCLRCK